MNKLEINDDEFWDIISHYGFEKAITTLKEAGFKLEEITGFIESHWGRF
jgi:hypothetical protein